MPLAWIALNSVNGLGPVRIKKLLEKYGSPEAVFKEPQKALLLENIIPEMCVKQLRDPSLFKYAEDQFERAKKSDIYIMTLQDKEYPIYLKEIFAPPPVLYVKGNRSVFSKHAVAVVGTRNPTQYGRTVTVSISRELIESKLVIVSGLAVGIDTASHVTALNCKGLTIAVLGSGIDRIYPAANKNLAESITLSGALVSEFPLGTPPESFNFPRRNRIISGLSAAVVVIEAGERSGSLITAHYALQQGRDVFAVPGPITSQASMGTFNLIKNGAAPARSGYEIAECLNVTTHPQFVNFTSCPTPCIPSELLSDSEEKVFDLTGNIPIRIDELGEKTRMSITELFSILLNLELKGLICQTGGQLFVRSAGM